MSNAAGIAASAIYWGLLLLAAILFVGLIAGLARRRLISASRRDDDDIWSLQQLREMRTEGRITNEEFEALKLKVLAASRATAGAKDGATSADERQRRREGNESIKGAAEQGR